jgi:predicted anti-sigma-YlaC factor YlaD
MFVRIPTLILRLGAAALVAAGLSGCSLKGMAVKAVANTLAAPSDVMTRDDDPQLIQDAIPFGLKTYESILESTPKHQPLLIATCAGYTSYAYGFVATPADLLQFTDHAASVAGTERALKMYLRAKDFCMRAVELRYPGMTKALMADPEAALKKTTKKDVELLYWTAASWGSAMSLGKDKPDLVIDFPIVRAMATRALQLDPAWSNGTIHELFITLDSQPAELGGSPEAARKHFEEAVRIQKGQLPGPYIELAEGLRGPNLDRAEFEKLMNQALALDPNAQPSVRLVTIIMQRRARGMLDHIDDLYSK